MTGNIHDCTCYLCSSRRSARRGQRIARYVALGNLVIAAACLTAMWTTEDASLAIGAALGAFVFLVGAFIAAFDA
jgi:hypothetical protein